MRHTAPPSLRYKKGLAALLPLLLCAGISCKSSDRSVDMDPAEPDPNSDTGVPCETHGQCSDGAFCNGEEVCFEGTCHGGATPRCDDGIECTEDRCSHVANNCVFAAPDEDGDGHSDAKCLGPDGEALGDDCDDDDATRFPGNIEICAPGNFDHDEDCDDRTFGHLDADQDGVVSDKCCNESSDGSPLCGTDCDDDEFRRYPNHAEICDDLDNDCNGKVDDETREVPWYPDRDGDNFGGMSDDAILSCAPIEAHSLRPTDCDDSSPGIHSAAIEVCDGFDNNCDGTIDEDDVCACSPDGKAQPCACSGTRTGVQICDAGTWGACECNECVNGSLDCIAGILPRLCVDGLWEFQTACTGQFSECNEGICTCPGGGMDCPDVNSMPGVPPFVIATIPADPFVPFDPTGQPSVTFSEDIDPGSTAGVALFDAFGTSISGMVSVSGSTVTFFPTSALPAGMEYRFEFPAALADVGGDFLASPEAIRFITRTGLVPNQFSSDPNLAFALGRLAMSPGGTLLAVIQEENKALATVRSVAIDWMAGSWGPIVEVTPTWPPHGWELAIDDAGSAIAVGYDGGTLARYDRIGISWLGPEITVAASGSSTRNLTVLNGSGRGFYVFENAGTALELVGRDSGGLFDAPLTTPLTGSDIGRAAAINPFGVGAVATQIGGSLQVWHSAIDLMSFTMDVLDSSVHNQDVAVGDDSKKFVAYSKNISAATPPDQVFVQVFDASWGGAIDVAPSGGGDEFDPQIGVDAGGDVHVVFRKSEKLVTAMMPSGGSSFSPTIELGRPDFFPVVNYELAVASTGDAVLVWTQHNGEADDLWARRYRKGAGWQPATLLEEHREPIGLFDVASDATGKAFVVFEILGSGGVDSLVVEVPPSP